MAYEKVVSNIMTRKGQSSRWAPRAIVKEAARKRRRSEGKQACRAEAR